MRYFHLEGEIDYPLFNKIVDFCNNNQDHPWTIIIDTVGGNGAQSQSIVHLFNEHLKNHPITFLVHKAYSGGFHILQEVHAKRIFTRYALGMVHQATTSLSMSVLNKPSYWEGDAMFLQNSQTIRRMGVEWAATFLNAKELRDFKRDKDIYLTTKRMMEIFPESTII
jgi:ATP-dependent protease ClpP protease subunit